MPPNGRPSAGERRHIRDHGAQVVAPGLGKAGVVMPRHCLGQTYTPALYRPGDLLVVPDDVPTIAEVGPELANRQDGLALRDQVRRSDRRT